MGSRRRDELDRLLDRLVAGGEPEATGDLAPLLHPARVARATLVRTTRPGVATDHLSTLRWDRTRDVVAVPAVRRRGLRAAGAALLLGAVLLLGAGGAVAASANALPGDALYGVKRAVERVSLAMHRDPVGRAALHLQFAQTRLDEIGRLIALGRDPGEDVDAFGAEVEAAEADALKAQALGLDADALLAHVQEMIAKHIDVLNRVLGDVPPQARDAIRHAIDNARNANDKIQHGRSPVKPRPPKGKPTSPPGKSGGTPGRP